MKKAILSLVLILPLLFSSCEYSFSDVVDRYVSTSFSDPFDDVKENTFLADKFSWNVNGGNDFSFVIITDEHFGAKGTWGTSAFVSWLDGIKSDITFVASLGDQTDYSRKSELQSYIDLIVTPVEAMSIPVVSIMGNHDSVNGGLADYKSMLGYEHSFFRFSCNDIEFYVLDSSLRTLGRKQLEYFKEAMNVPKTKKRVILSHVPIYGTLSEAWGTLYDSLERARIINAYHDGKVSLSLSGHVHRGIDPFEMFEGCNEYVLKSFIGENGGSDYPRWYRVDYDASESKLTFTCYYYKNGVVSSDESRTLTL